MSRWLCEEKTKLLFEYQQATAQYSKAVSALTRNIGLVPKNEYDRLRTATERARQLTQIARENLQTHTHKHQC